MPLPEKLLPEKIRRMKAPPKRREPLWKGPEVDGVTYSLLSRYLVCKERFRLLVVEGLRPREGWNHRLEFGNMWHLCEEAHQGGAPWSSTNIVLNGYADSLHQRFPFHRPEVETCLETVRLMFPIRVAYWKGQAEERARAAVFPPETVFDVKYPLPSGRTVRLRGKWDDVSLVGSGRGKKVYVGDTKTKSDVDELKITRQLRFDLQTMIYLVAFGGTPLPPKFDGRYPVGGIRYNVVRRPRHYQGKKETAEGFYERLRRVISESPGDYFFRWTAEVSPGDIDRFRAETLDPLLENLCNWWMVQTGALAGTQARQDYLINYGHHWRHPFGVYNVLDEGGSSDLDEYLETGSEAGLERTTNLFRELDQCRQ